LALWRAAQRLIKFRLDFDGSARRTEPMTSYADSARLVMERCDTLGGISEEPDRLTRRYGTEEMRRANAAVAEWMREAGMQTRSDAIGNLIGRSEGSSPDAKTFMLGSHLDSVRDAGKYDGPLGVMVALACVVRLHARGERLPFALEVYAFADEEGLRYHTAYLGSSVAAGSFDSALLTREDAEGISLAQAIRAFGGDPDRLAESTRRPDELLGYAEVHIEQGPMLEERGYPVGLVSAIQGQSRISVTFTGEAGHAGTVPMWMRHDALCAAAELVLAAEMLAKGAVGADSPYAQASITLGTALRVLTSTGDGHPSHVQDFLATVGQLSIEPGASNVIPGRATLSLDVRHPDDKVRVKACENLERRAREIAARRGLRLDWRVAQETATVACSKRLTKLLRRAIESRPALVHILPSGAGHDAAIMSQITEIAMLFVRCERGISHSPAEAVAVEDVATAIEVTERFLSLLTKEVAGGGAR
jgi:allantoate deiminase